MSDIFDQVFGEEQPEEEYYPGSRRRRASASETEAPDPDSWKFNCFIKIVGGEEIRLYPISAIASALRVSVPTIRYWTRMGYLPTEPYRLPNNMIINGERAKGRRLYTAPMIEAAVAAFEERDLLDRPQIRWSHHPDLPIEIHEAWTRLYNNQPK